MDKSQNSTDTMVSCCYDIGSSHIHSHEMIAVAPAKKKFRFWDSRNKKTKYKSWYVLKA